jgi:hypothetical protein
MLRCHGDHEVHEVHNEATKLTETNEGLTARGTLRARFGVRHRPNPAGRRVLCVLRSSSLLRSSVVNSVTSVNSTV